MRLALLFPCLLRIVPRTPARPRADTTMKTLDVGEPAALNAQHLDLDKSLEDYLLLVLSDSNLPTGGFVASSGLESWLQHGYSSIAEPATRTGSAAELSAPPLPNAPDGPINAFISQSLHSYARLNLPLVRPAHAAVKKMPLGTGEETESSSRAVETAFASILAVDILCETMTLNHVARRASVAQGVALLTLYDRAFAPPIGSSEASRDDATIRLVAGYRNAVKTAENGCNGHMSVAFGVLTAAIGVGIGALQFLFLPPWPSSPFQLKTDAEMVDSSRCRICTAPVPIPACPITPILSRANELDRTLPRSPHARQRHPAHDFGRSTRNGPNTPARTRDGRG